MSRVIHKIAELIEDGVYCPLPVEVIPNQMGINLCSVDCIEWKKQKDGQLVYLTIYFQPEPEEEPKDCCPYCDDGLGSTAYPYYGLAPHYHLKENGEEWEPGSKEPLDKTVFEDRDTWPENFKPEDNGRAGIYTHCLYCGAGDNPETSE